MKLVINVKPVVEGYARGDVLLVNRNISFLGDVDPDSGVLRNYGSIRDKLLVFPGVSGSTVGPYIIYSLAKRAKAPKAMIVRNVDPLLITGCVLANIPLAVVIDDWVVVYDKLERCCANGCVGTLLSEGGVLVIE